MKKEQANLIGKYAAGKCTEEEARKVIGWFKSPEQHLNLYQGMRGIWQRETEANEEQLEKADLEGTLDRLHHRMNIYSEEEEANSGSGRRFIRILSRVAAVLFLPLLLTTSLYVSERIDAAMGDEQYTELYVSHGSKINTQLPDGTLVWLNSGSTLKYPQSFTRRKRQVELLGEAYFEVAHDPSHPFIVNAGDIDLRVLGTKFNVMAYPDEDHVSATLEQGKVSVERVNDERKASWLCYLEPGEHAVYTKEKGTISKSLIRTDKYTSWKDGKLIFRNDPLEEVIIRLERWYNVEIEIAGDHRLPETPYTLTIEDESITQVLEYLEVASAISWEMVPPEKKAKGEFTKTRYIISN
jgi:transmembrane sensor